VKKSLLVILCSLLSIIAYSQEKALSDIEALMNCRITIPESFSQVPKVQQEDAWYDIAFRKSLDEEEYRIAFYPMSMMPKGFSDLKNDKDVMRQLFMMLYIVTLNVSGNGDYDIKKIRQFKDRDVNSDFNADKGFYCFCEAKSDFSKGFKYISIHMIYKKDYCVCFIFVLISDFENYMKRALQKDSQRAYYCVKFN